MAPGGHMSPDEFRKHGHAVIEWLAAYMEGVENYPVASQLSPGDVRARLPEHAPEHGEPFADIIEDLDDIIMPGITHWQSPNFFAYFPANASPPAILGELVSAGLGVQGMLWATSPACTELETHMLDWLVDLMGLPEEFRSSGPGGGVIQDSASSAALCALVAARHRASPGDLKVYTSSHAHSSIEKAVRIAGFGDDALRLVDVDDDFALRPDALAAGLASDVAAGATPCLVAATSGTASSMAFDPLRPVADICGQQGGDRLPRLAGAARPPLPIAQAVVRAALLRSGRVAGDDPQTRRARFFVRVVGGGLGRLRAVRAGASEPRLLPAPGRRRGQPRASGAPQLVGQAIPHPHEVERPHRPADVDRSGPHRAEACGRGLGADSGRGPGLSPRPSSALFGPLRPNFASPTTPQVVGATMFGLRPRNPPPHGPRDVAGGPNLHVPTPLLFSRSFSGSLVSSR